MTNLKPFCLLLLLALIFPLKISAQQTVQVDDSTEVNVDNNTVKIDTTTTNKDNSVKIPNIATNTSLISITSPINGESSSNTQLTIVGRSPAGILVDVMLSYIESTNFINANSQKTYLGTVTSDQNGLWAYVPTVNLPEGKYTVVASFEGSDGTISKSEAVSIYITTLQNNVLIAIIVFVVVLILILLSLLISKIRKEKNRSAGDKTSTQPTPIFFLNPNQGRFIQEAPITQSVKPESIILKRNEDNVNLPVENVLKQDYNKDTSQKILELLKNNPNLTRNDLAKELDITADGVKYHLKNLEADGKLVHEGSKKSGEWVVKD